MKKEKEINSSRDIQASVQICSTDIFTLKSGKSMQKRTELKENVISGNGTITSEK